MVAILAALHALPLDQAAFPRVAEAHPSPVQTPVVAGVSSPSAQAWAAPRMVEAHEKVVGHPSQVVVVGPVEGDQEGICLQGQVAHWGVWDL